MPDAKRYLRKQGGGESKRHKFLKKMMIFELYIKVFLKKNEEKGVRSVKKGIQDKEKRKKKEI